MPEIVLARWDWKTPVNDEPHWAAPTGGVLGCLDFRPLPAQALAGGAPQGFGLFVYPDGVIPAGSLSLQRLLGRVLTLAQKDAIGSRLDITEPLEGATLRDVLWNILGVHADPTGQNRPKPLMPTRDRRLELHLGGFSLIQSVQVDTTIPEWPNILATLQEDYRHIRRERLARLGASRLKVLRYLAAEYRHLRRRDAFDHTHQRYLAHLARQYGLDYRQFIPANLPDEGVDDPHTVITDAFTRADADALGTSSEGWSWTETTGDIDISGNEARIIDLNTPARGRAESDLSTANHYAQANCSVVNPFPTGDDEVGLAVRYAAAAATLYAQEEHQDATSRHVILKTVAGSSTNLFTDDTNQFANNDLVRLEVNGSTLTTKVAGVTRLTGTDTAITGNLRTGLRGKNGPIVGATTWDNFEAGDLGFLDVIGSGGIIPFAR